MAPAATGPYTSGSSTMKPTGKPPQATAPGATTQAALAPNVVGSQAVRATGQGPYDPAYRQNLATYAGGLFARPNGNLSFNPTGNLQDMGNQASGGGNAPVQGTPQGLLDQALGGMPYVYNPQTSQTPSSTATTQNPPWNPNFWNNFLGQYSNFLNRGGGQ
jgi:hypothetical protein